MSKSSPPAPPAAAAAAAAGLHGPRQIQVQMRWRAVQRGAHWNADEWLTLKRGRQDRVAHD